MYITHLLHTCSAALCPDSRENLFAFAPFHQFSHLWIYWRSPLYALVLTASQKPILWPRPLNKSDIITKIITWQMSCLGAGYFTPRLLHARFSISVETCPSNLGQATWILISIEVNYIICMSYNTFCKPLHFLHSLCLMSIQLTFSKIC